MLTQSKLLYRVNGFSRRYDISMGSCIFCIELDAEFAKACLNFKITSEQSKRLLDGSRLMLQDKNIRMSFLNDSFLLSSFSVSGDCCCLGIDGNEQNPEHWYKNIEYHGHNIDSRNQAYDLLSIFCHWVDVAEAVVIPIDFKGTKI
jgi:hypothetical protein